MSTQPEPQTPTSSYDGPDIPEKSWSNPFAKGTFLHEWYDDVASENRDGIMIIDDYLGRRGTGKTIASLQSANAMDQTDEGLVWEKTALQPEKVRNAYSHQPLRSGILMDEAEYGASNRQAMTKTNQALREICSMGRVEQKYLVINTPIKSFIDKDLLKLADVWISMVRRGLGLVHELRWEPYSENLLTPRKQWIEFEDVPRSTPLRGVYNQLTGEKRKYIDGGDGDPYIPLDEHEDILDKELENKERETRNEILRRLGNTEEFKNSDITYQQVADQLGLSRGHVSNIVNGSV